MTPTEALTLAAAHLAAVDPTRELRGDVLGDDALFWCPLAPAHFTDGSVALYEVGGPGGVLVDRVNGIATAEPTAAHRDRIAAMLDVAPGLVFHTRLGVVYALASAPLVPAEWRLGADGWVELPGFPILGALLDGDTRLDEASLPAGINPPPVRRHVRPR